MFTFERYVRESRCLISVIVLNEERQAVGIIEVCSADGILHDFRALRKHQVLRWIQILNCGEVEVVFIDE